MERLLKTIFFLLLIAHGIAVSFFVWSGYQAVLQPRPIPEAQRIYTIEAGKSFNTLLEDLYQKQLAPKSVFVRMTLALKGQDNIVIKKGTYELPEEASALDLVKIFEEGKVQLFKVTIPEGYDRWQTAKVLGERGLWGDEETFLKLIEDPQPILHLDPGADSLEGYLYPETYFFPKTATAKDVINTLIQSFISHTDDLRPQLEERGLSIRQWLSLAALVEEESSIREERALVAGVFQNRLDRGMLLQCDPTIIYSLKLHNRYRGKIYRSDIKYDHPYNTYVYKGLPPGPIANPARESLEAALNPAETDYLFFVAKEDGSHHFSRTNREHNRAVRKFLRSKGR